MRIGIIGGTGLGAALSDAMGAAQFEAVTPDTPFGAPSGPVMIGDLGDVPVALLARHGDGHLLNPHHVPYRANIFALKTLGVTHVLASAAVGSLREEIEPGDLVICDQLIDKTEGRPRTFYERAAVHVEFAEPFCPVVRRWLRDAARSFDGSVHKAGTYVCMEGPSFSTVAESHMHRAWGGDLIGMTCCPEARLAREAEIAYGLVALVTDYDCWRPRAEHGAGLRPAGGDHREHGAGDGGVDRTDSAGLGRCEPPDVDAEPGARGARAGHLVGQIEDRPGGDRAARSAVGPALHGLI
jgi:5'-methylthioadenosine phosphorylase